MPPSQRAWPRLVTFYIIQHVNDPDSHEKYVGATLNLRRRRIAHRNNSFNPRTRMYGYKLYKHVRQHGGWKNFDFIRLSTRLVETKTEQDDLELFYINEHDAKLNGGRPGALNRAGSKKSYDRERTDTLIVCGCGLTHSLRNRYQHLKSKKHRANMANQTVIHIINHGSLNINTTCAHATE